MPAQPDDSSIASLLRQAAARLSLGPHPERARLDAESLFLHVTNQGRAWLMAHGSDPFPPSDAIRFHEFIGRRLTGEPIQYILGEAEFYGLPFRVAPAVLIPRPETEHLVEKALHAAASLSSLRILDIGTGSGAIAVAVAHQLAQASVTAIDLSPEALAVAEENARRNGVPIRFLQGDLFAPVSGEAFELILSNPPYIPTADRDTLSVEVREHEPSLALFAGEDGLGIYRRLIPAAYEHLVPGGFLLLEIGYGQGPAVGELLRESQFEEIEFIPDLQSIPRVACARRA